MFVGIFVFFFLFLKKNFKKFLKIQQLIRLGISEEIGRKGKKGILLKKFRNQCFQIKKPVSKKSSKVSNFLRLITDVHGTDDCKFFFQICLNRGDKFF